MSQANVLISVKVGLQLAMGDKILQINGINAREMNIVLLSNETIHSERHETRL